MKKFSSNGWDRITMAVSLLLFPAIYIVDKAGYKIKPLCWHVDNFWAWFYWFCLCWGFYIIVRWIAKGFKVR